MTKVVSFKLSDEEYSALAAFQLENKNSPSLAAKRIVREALGLPQSTKVYSQEVEELIQVAIATLRQELQQQIEELRGELPA